MNYKRPEDIDVFFINQYEFPKEMREIMNANFRDIAFCIFTLLDNGYHKIGYFKVKVENQENFMYENIKLFYIDKCIFELKECSNGAWIAIPKSDPDTIITFTCLIDNKFNVWN